MGHHVVYLTQSLDPRLRERKANEVASFMGRSPEQVHRLLEQAPGKVTHPTSLEMAEHIKHIFEHAGLYAEIREVEESFAEPDVKQHNNEALHANQLVADSLPVLADARLDSGGASTTLSVVSEIDDNDLPEAAVVEDEVGEVIPDDIILETRPWVRRLQALSALLALLLLLVLLLWWRNNQQNQLVVTSSAQQHMRQLVALTRGELNRDATLSSEALEAKLEPFNKLNPDFLGLFNGSNVAASTWQGNGLSPLDSSALESKILRQVARLSETQPSNYSLSRLQDGQAVVWAERFQANYRDYILAGVFRSNQWLSLQQNSNLVMALIVAVVLASLLLTLALARALRS